MMLSKKAMALMLVGIMLFSIVFSALVIMIDGDHDCTVENCQVCQNIQLCIERLSGTGSDNKEEALHVLFAVFFAVLTASVCNSGNALTLVAQKVKLSN